MFYCENCQKKNHWPEPSARSKGRCEICDALAVCFNCPSSALGGLRPIIVNLKLSAGVTTPIVKKDI